MLTNSERQLEVVSRNISNVSTPGYKSGLSFQAAIAKAVGASPQVLGVHTDLSQGALRATGRALDLAISGPGMFRMVGAEGAYYTRSGQFDRDSSGRVVNANGMALQTASGDDLIVQGENIEVLDDGSVVEDSVLIGRIALFEPEDSAQLNAVGGTVFTANSGAMREVAAPTIRSGMLEMANVNAADEMVRMMATMRQAEAGARVVQAYDSLIGQSISTFGRSSR